MYVYVDGFCVDTIGVAGVVANTTTFTYMFIVCVFSVCVHHIKCMLEMVKFCSGLTTHQSLLRKYYDITWRKKTENGEIISQISIFKSKVILHSNSYPMIPILASSC